MNKRVSFLITLFVFIFFFSNASASSSLDVVINEIAWMGTNASANDEWVELYNGTDNNISLDGWVLKADDGRPEITLSGTITAHGFYLMERTDDQTLPAVSADKIYSGALSNAGENLKLYNASGVVIDQADCQAGWFKGNAKPDYKTMERVNPLLAGADSNWQASQDSGGTPKEKNSSGSLENPTPAPQQTKTRTEKENNSLVVYPLGIIFTEVLPSPEGSDKENEWIEISNQSAQEINLSGWKITDVSGKIKAYTFPAGSKISPGQFLVLGRPVTGITLNNDGDGLLLNSPDGRTADQMSYTKAPRQESYNKTEGGWEWSSVLTPGQTNNTAPRTESSNNSGLGSSKELAALAGQSPEQSGFLSLLITGILVAFFSAIVILIIKTRVLKNR